MSSPTRRAAAAPASVAALTAATSPRTIAVTYPEPIFSQPTRLTFAAFTIASAASIIATRPRVSIIPRASPIGLSPSRTIYQLLYSVAAVYERVNELMTHNSPPKLGGEPEPKRGRGGSLNCHQRQGNHPA